jgi:hypothetical protein
MKRKEIIEVIKVSNIPVEKKAEIIKHIKKEKTQDAILTILKTLGISIEVISWFKDID